VPVRGADVHMKPQPGLTGLARCAVRERLLKLGSARFGRFSDAPPTAEDRVYSVHPPWSLRVLLDNPLNDKQYADVIFLALIARQVEGRNTGTTP
jgi:hypothetical protein